MPIDWKPMYHSTPKKRNEEDDSTYASVSCVEEQIALADLFQNLCLNPPSPSPTDSQIGTMSRTEVRQ